MEKVLTKQRETKIIEDNKIIINKEEYYKVRTKKFIKLFKVYTLSKINMLSAGGKAALFYIILHIRRDENDFFIQDIKGFWKHIYKYLKELENEDIIKKIEKGHYILNPYIAAYWYDSNIEYLYNKRLRY